MKTITIAAIIVVVAVGALALSQSGTNLFPQSITYPQTATTGRTVLAIADAAVNLSNINSIQITVDSVEVHSAQQGWVTASSTPKTYDLIALNATGLNALLADIQLKAGTYEQIRLNISQITVTDNNGTHVAKLPSGELKIAANIVVNANSTSTAVVDFLAAESLHATGNGDYIFAPVVHVQTKENASVAVKSQNDVEINGGATDMDERVGMDVNGNVGVGLEISADKKLSIDSNGKVGISIG